MNINECVSNMFDLEKGSEKTYCISEFDETVDIKFYKRNNSKDAIIVFGGAHRTQAYCLKNYPIFSEFFYPKTCNIIVIEDFIFSYLNNLTPDNYIFTKNISFSSWYCLSQKVLCGLLKTLKKKYFTNKMIFVGGSSGGFASLYFSSFITDSICVTINPQINIEQQIINVKNQLEPNDSINEKFDYIIKEKTINITTVYNKPLINNILYIINNASKNDLLHMNTFSSHIINNNFYDFNKFMLKSEFWGTIGHSGSVPKNEYLLWVKASLESEKNDVISINKKYLENKNENKTSL